MKCQEVKINIPEFIDGKLNKETNSLISAHIKACESCREIHAEFSSFMKFTDSFAEIEPPKDMKDEFLMMAEMEGFGAKTRKLHIPDWFKAAAMIILALGTFAAGYFSGAEKNDNAALMAEVKSLKQEVALAGLRDYSGPQKIEAVYSVGNDNSSSDVVDALVYTLNSDKNMNVRLAALSVLSGMVNENALVKKELIHALTIQEDPLLQISLIQVLTESGVKEAKENIERISNDNDTDPNVKEYAENMIKTII